MQHVINQTVQNASVGVPQAQDGIGLLFFDCPTNSVVTGSGFSLDTPYLLTKLGDLEALGITAAFDSTNGTRIHQDVSDFYTEANLGSLIWVVMTNVAGTFSSYISATNGAHDKAIIATGNGTFSQKAKIVGYCYLVPTTATGSGDFPSDVAASISAAATKQATMSGLGYPYYAVVDGYAMNPAKTASTLATATSFNAPYVSLNIGAIHPNGVSAMGAYLGKLSKISIGTSPGFVDNGNGAINFDAAYLTSGLYIAPSTGTLTVGDIATVFGVAGTDTVTYNGVTYQVGSQFTVVSGHTTYTATGTAYVCENVKNILSLSPSNASGTGDIDILGSKQFLFIRNFSGSSVSGLYWNDGATCEPSTQTIVEAPQVRIANHFLDAARSFIINYAINAQVITDNSGNVSKLWSVPLQSLFAKTYFDPLANGSGTGDINSGTLTITGVNFKATKQLSYTITINQNQTCWSVTSNITLQ
jgi:hypothetical protein